MRRIRVVVTAEDIAAGAEFVVGDRCTTCPFARALRRRFPHAWASGVSWSPEWLTPGFRLSRRAKQFIRAADDATRTGALVQPATFYLEGPDQ